MCGILLCFSPNDDNCPQFHDRLLKLKHRGPDDTVIKRFTSSNITTLTVGFVRNAISHVLNGTQPLETDDFIHVHNGEFYQLSENDKRQVELGYEDWNYWGMNTTEAYKESTESDSNLLKSMTSENAFDFATQLDGIFAYCSYDKKNQDLYVSRDRVGIVPLYYVKEVEEMSLGMDTRVYERIWFASEAKALIGLGEIHMFPPNTTMRVSFNDIDMKITKRLILPPYFLNDDKDKVSYKEHIENIDRLLRYSIIKRNQFEVPWAVSLSGGVDSSYVAFMKMMTTGGGGECMKNELEKNFPTRFGFNNMHTFTIGLKGSKELETARQYAVSSMVNSYHHEVIVTVDEALACLEDVIYCIESFDVTTVRASVMNWLLAKNMKKYGIKVVYSGEGADELFAGYLYFHHAPTPAALAFETKRKMEQLCYYDCLRVNKCFAAFGIECRVPFLDKDVVDYVMKIDPVHKMSSTHPAGKKQEKHLLRNSFYNSASEKFMMHEWGCRNPENYIYQTKDQFSDSVGKGWINALKKRAAEVVSDEELEKAATRFPFQTPNDKESYYYREIFEKLFLCDGKKFVRYTPKSTACSTKVASEWSKSTVDPSGAELKGNLEAKAPYEHVVDFQKVMSII